MATAAYPAPGFDPTEYGFTNGEEFISVVDGGSAPAATTFYLARTLQLPPGKYRIKLFVDDYGMLRFGSDMNTLRTVMKLSIVDGARTGEFIVHEGESRFDLVLFNNASGPCNFIFSIWRDDQLVHASSSDDWQFDSEPISDDELLGGQDPRLLLPVFSVMPNWKNGVLERLQWNTDVMRSEEAVEQRRSIRRYPMRSFEASFLRTESVRARLDNFFLGMGNKPFMLPLWHEQYRSEGEITPADSGFAFGDGSLVDREFRPGDVVMLTAGDPDLFDIGIIDEVLVDTNTFTWATPPTITWPAGTRLIPMRRARMIDFPQFNNLSSHVGQVSARFELTEPDDQFQVFCEDGEPDTTFEEQPSWGNCSPLFQFKPNRSTPVVVDYAREAFVLGSDSGPSFYVDPSDQGRSTQRMNLLLRGRDMVFAFRRFIAQARGQTLRFYMPSGTSDIVPAGDIDGDAFLAKPSGLWETMSVPQRSRIWITVLFKDGSSPIYRKVVNVEPVGVVALPTRMVQSEQYTLASPLPAISVENIERIMFVSTSRFDQDTFELMHHSDSSRAVSAAVVTRTVDMAVREI